VLGFFPASAEKSFFHFDHFFSLMDQNVRPGEENLVVQSVTFRLIFNQFAKNCGIHQV